MRLYADEDFWGLLMEQRQFRNQRPLSWWFYAFAALMAAAGAVLLKFTHWPLHDVLPLYLVLIIAAFWAGWRRAQ